MELLYKDDAMLVIDKPAGMPVLPDGWEAQAPYVVRLLEQDFSKVWVVHRLDKVTSGVMVLALTAQAHRALSIQFEQHQVLKVYHAICNGVPAWDEHTAGHRLRVNVGHSHRTVVDNGRGLSAETHFKVLERYAGHALLECTPASGRTHQIRVHAYALGYALVGDSLYSAPATDLIARPALHACSLTLVHPLTDERMTFTAPYPPDFSAALTRLATDQ